MKTLILLAVLAVSGNAFADQVIVARPGQTDTYSGEIIGKIENDRYSGVAILVDATTTQKSDDLFSDGFDTAYSPWTVALNYFDPATGTVNAVAVQLRCATTTDTSETVALRCLHHFYVD